MVGENVIQLLSTGLDISSGIRSDFMFLWQQN